MRVAGGSWLSHRSARGRTAQITAAVQTKQATFQIIHIRLAAQFLPATEARPRRTPLECICINVTSNNHYFQIPQLKMSFKIDEN